MFRSRLRILAPPLAIALLALAGCGGLTLKDWKLTVTAPSMPGAAWRSRVLRTTVRNPCSKAFAPLLSASDAKQAAAALAGDDSPEPANVMPMARIHKYFETVMAVSLGSR